MGESESFRGPLAENSRFHVQECKRSYHGTRIALQTGWNRLVLGSANIQLYKYTWDPFVTVEAT